MRFSIKAAGVLFSALLVGGAAEAAQIACSGSALGYTFNLRARSSGSRVVGRVNVTVTQGTRTVKQDSLTPTASSIQPRRSLQFTARSAGGGGSVNATYDAGSGLYYGTLSASGPQGSVNTSVTCRLSGLTDMEAEEAIVE